jgi:flagellar protein FlaF
MQNQAVQAYQQTGRTTVPQRDLEANLLSMAAAHLQRIRNEWELLKFNRKLWTVFVTSVTDPESKLPPETRESIANLGIFVLSRTAELQLVATPEKLDALININRQLAAGLRASPSDDVAA